MREEPQRERMHVTDGGESGAVGTCTAPVNGKRCGRPVFFKRKDEDGYKFYQCAAKHGWCDSSERHKPAAKVDDFAEIWGGIWPII